jgi:hypothetical protein
MNKLLVFCGLLLIGFTSQKVIACSCAGESTIEGGFKSADIVVSGLVISSVNEWIADSSEILELNELGISIDSLDKRLFGQYFRKVQIVIDELYKGKVDSDTITIYTGLGGGDCGFHFNIGRKYILYGDSNSYLGSYDNNRKYRDDKNIFWTNICTRTQEYNRQEANSLEKLKK